MAGALDSQGSGWPGPWARSHAGDVPASSSPTSYPVHQLPRVRADLSASCHDVLNRPSELVEPALTGHLTRNGGQSDFFVWPVGQRPEILVEGEAYDINDGGWLVGRAGVRGMFLWHERKMLWFADMVDGLWRGSRRLA